MQSGLHSHYCNTCQKPVDCPQITHCKRPDETPCIDCRAAEYAKHESGFIEGRAEEHYYKTGKWPGE